MTTRRTNWRSFTLLETVLAAAIGSMVALAALGLFMTIDRTDAMLAARYRQTASLERAHRVLSRAFLSLVTSDKPQPRPVRIPTGSTSAAPAAGTKPPVIPTGPGAPTAPTSATSGAPPTALATGDQPPSEPPPPPRLRLSVDQAMSSQRMFRPGTQGMPSEPVQMFEVVVHTSPVGPVTPGRSAAAPDDSQEADVQTSFTDKSTGKKSSNTNEPPRLLSPTGKVYRGAFVLRPTRNVSDENEPTDTPSSWTLWWQPLPPAREDAQSSAAPTPPDTAQAVELTPHISYFRWKVYDDRERKQEYSAVWRTELPAYVEVELATTAGLWANWMFEVDWVDGSEAAPDATTNETATDTSPTPTTTTTKIVPVK